MSEPSELTGHLGYSLRQVSNNVSHAFARKVEATGVTVAEWVVLRRLWGRGAVAPSRLAEETGLTRGAVSKLADRLLAKKLIERMPSATDRRAHTLALTRPAEALVPQLAEIADRNDAEFFGSLDAGDRAELERILRLLAEQGRLCAAPID